MALGVHGLEYEVLQGWEKLPDRWSFVEVAGVAVDSRDRVYVFCRGEHPLIVFDQEGHFLTAWGEGVFDIPHGVFIDHHDRLYLSDSGDHTIRVYSIDGELLQTIGNKDQPSDTGFEEDVSPVIRGGEPFNRVTNVAVRPDGTMFVSDGYGNARVHRFSADGTLERSWGEPGDGPGEFNLPHGIGVDSAGTVYVADRENSRIQLFTSAGEYVTEWAFCNRPTDIFIDSQDNIYVAELGFRVATTPSVHYPIMERPPSGHDPIARVTICDPDGQIHARIGGDEEGIPGNFVAPHGLWADSRGDLYIGEVVAVTGAIERLSPLPVSAFQKFVRSG